MPDNEEFDDIEYWDYDAVHYDDSDDEPVSVSQSKENESMYCKIDLAFTDRPDSSTIFAPLSDKLSIDCGDYSKERLETLLDEMERKVRKAWAYMADRTATNDLVQ